MNETSICTPVQLWAKEHSSRKLVRPGIHVQWNYTIDSWKKWSKVSSNFKTITIFDLIFFSLQGKQSPLTREWKLPLFPIDLFPCLISWWWGKWEFHRKYISHTASLLAKPYFGARAESETKRIFSWSPNKHLPSHCAGSPTWVSSTSFNVKKEFLLPQFFRGLVLTWISNMTWALQERKIIY